MAYFPSSVMNEGSSVFDFVGKGLGDASNAFKMF